MEQLFNYKKKFRFKSLNIRLFRKFYKNTKARFTHILFIIIPILAFSRLEIIR